MIYDYIAFIHVFQQFFFCACGAAGRQEGVNLAVGGSNRSQLAVGRVVRVGWLQAEQQGSVGCRQSSKGRLAAGRAAKVCSGGSTVPAAVVIVVKYRACLPVSRLIVGV